MTDELEVHFPKQQGKDHTDRKGFLGLGLSRIEVPHIAFIAKCVGNGLCRIDYAAAAYGKNQVNALFPGFWVPIRTKDKRGLGVTPPKAA